MSRDPHARRWAVFAAVGVGTFLNVLDMSMLNVALPTVARELGADVGTVQWVVTGYLLVTSALLLTGGRLGDVYGRKRIYLGGLALFALASTLAGFAADAHQLIALRLLQGVGAALVQGIGMAIVTAAFPAAERGRALGLTATVVALGGSSGPVAGGVVADALGWRWLFWARVPLALLALWATARAIPADPGGRGRPRFDVGGAATLFVALAALLLALSQGRHWGWGSPAVLGLSALGLLCLAAFLWLEARLADPMLPLGIFGDRVFAAANASAFLAFCAISGSFFLMPFFLIDGLGLAPSQAGVLLVPGMALMSVSAPVSGALSDRFGSRVLSPLGLLVVCAGLLQLGRLTAEAGALEVVWRSALVGLGMGVFASPNSSALMGAVRREQLGLAAGAQASMRNVGGAVGTALAAAVLADRAAFHAPALAAAGLSGAALEARALVGGVQDAYAVAAVIAALGLAVALLRGPARGRRAAPLPSERLVGGRYPDEVGTVAERR